MRKISTERYNSGTKQPAPPDIQDRDRPGSNIRIYVTPGNSTHKSCSPVVEIGIDPYKKQTHRTQHQPQVHATDSTLLQAAFSTAPSTSPTLSKDSIYRGPPSSAGSRGSLGGDSVTGLADSGVWVKSYHSSSSTDMLDGVGAGNVDSTSSSANIPTVSTVVMGGDYNMYSSDQDTLAKIASGRPARKTSYLSAVNAPSSRSEYLFS